MPDEFPEADEARESDAVAGEPAAAAGEDTLRRLEQRLDRASETAERLIAQAAERVTGKPPPAGWQPVAPDGGPSGDSGAGPGAQRARSDSVLGADADLLLGILGALRDRIPAELQQRLADAVREVLLALRALIDWYLERSERRRGQPVEVQDIPIL